MKETEQETQQEAAPAPEMQERQVLTEKDLHCIARILQGSIYGNNLFQYCDCCPNVDDCRRMARQSCTNYFNRVRPKLQIATGVYLGPLIDADLIRGKVNPGTAAESPAQ